MAILMIHEAPGGTQEQYEQVAARVAAGGSFDSPGDWPVGGLLFHAAGPTDNGWRVVDVWESEQAFQSFGAIIGPVLQEIGFPGEPKVFPLHNLVQ